MTSQAAYVRSELPGLLPGFYYADDFAGPTLRDAIIAGPFATYAAADADRATCNIAGDCSIVEVVALPDSDPGSAAWRSSSTRTVEAQVREMYPHGIAHGYVAPADRPAGAGAEG